MKLQRTTLILILLALGLGGFVYFYEIQGATQRQEAKARKQQIFSFVEEQVQALKVKTKEQTLQFERSDKAGKAKWQMKVPVETPASDASISYLMDLLVTGKSDGGQASAKGYRTFQVASNQLHEYGLVQPQATIEVKLKNNEIHRLILGKRDFSGNALYAQADPAAKPADSLDVMLVSTDIENAVNRQLSEWKSSNSHESTPKEFDQASPSPSP